MKKIIVGIITVCLVLLFSPSIIRAQCVASFSTNAVCRGVANNFTDVSTVPFPDSLIKEIWNYGDGESDTLLTGFDISHTHLYTSLGLYSVSLTIFSKTGCTNTVNANVTVRTNPSVADSFTYKQTPCETGGYDVLFALNNKGLVGTIFDSWTFGDGTKLSNVQIQ